LQIDEKSAFLRFFLVSITLLIKKVPANDCFNTSRMEYLNSSESSNITGTLNPLFANLLTPSEL